MGWEDRTTKFGFSPLRREKEPCGRTVNTKGNEKGVRQVGGQKKGGEIVLLYISKRFMRESGKQSS